MRPSYAGPSGVPPPKRVVDATFSLRVPLPSRFGGKCDPASRPASTPTLLKPRERRRLTEPRKSKPTPELTPSKVVNPLRLKRAKEPPPTPARGMTSPENRQEYERLRRQRPERQEAHRKAEKERRQRSKQLGSCRHCGNEAIPGQTRCETCAERYRQAQRRNDASRRERKEIESSN